MQTTTTLRITSGTLMLLILLNLIFLVLGLTVGLGSFVLEKRLLAWLTRNEAVAPEEMLTLMRIVLGLAMLAVIPAHRILVRLLAMVGSVQQGTTFAPENAVRLKAIAWSLLALQLIDVAIGWVGSRYEDYPGWSPNLTGWLAVLLLFVLARVFEQGAAMREELDATV